MQEVVEQLNSTARSLEFQRLILASFVGSGVERLTDGELEKLSYYLDALLQTARQNGYHDGIQFCIDHLRLIETPRGPERGM